MRVAIEPRGGMVFVRVNFRGPRRTISRYLLLDTGSAYTILHPQDIIEIGHDPSVGEPVRIVSGTGAARPFRLRVNAVEALGVTREYFPLVAHALPRESRIRGLLGLDFIRGHRLTVDLRDGFLELT